MAKINNEIIIKPETRLCKAYSWERKDGRITRSNDYEFCYFHKFVENLGGNVLALIEKDIGDLVMVDIETIQFCDDSTVILKNVNKMKKEGLVSND